MKPSSNPKPFRVSARLDRARATKLDYVKRATGLTASEILRHGIDLAYVDAHGRTRSLIDALTASGFVGCAVGPPDLSERYKEELAELGPGEHGDH